MDGRQRPGGRSFHIFRVAADSQKGFGPDDFGKGGDGIGQSDAAQSGAETSLPGFGKFKVKETSARDGRNPSTGATIKIAASKKLTFTPAKAVKDALNG